MSEDWKAKYEEQLAKTRLVDDLRMGEIGRLTDAARAFLAAERDYTIRKMIDPATHWPTFAGYLLARDRLARLVDMPEAGPESAAETLGAVAGVRVPDREVDAPAATLGTGKGQVASAGPQQAVEAPDPLAATSLPGRAELGSAAGTGPGGGE